VLSTIPVLAGPAIKSEKLERAVKLLGASNALLKEMGSKHQIGDQYEIDQFYKETHQIMGEEAFRKAWEQGAAMTYREAVDFAMSEE
jgi:hypothetical protein